jgi:hypothetical protein
MVAHAERSEVQQIVMSRRSRVRTMMALCWLLLVGMVGAADKPVAPIRELEGIQPKEDAFRPARPLRPLVLKSVEKAARYLSEEDVARLKKEVDFAQQVVLLFAWQGSGQDRLTYEVAESSPEKVAFERQPGLTRDLRPHVRVYVVSADVAWTVDGVAPPAGEEEVTWDEMKEIPRSARDDVPPGWQPLCDHRTDAGRGDSLYPGTGQRDSDCHGVIGGFRRWGS